MVVSETDALRFPPRISGHARSFALRDMACLSCGYYLLLRSLRFGISAIAIPIADRMSARSHAIMWLSSPVFGVLDPLSFSFWKVLSYPPYRQYNEKNPPQSRRILVVRIGLEPMTPAM